MPLWVYNYIFGGLLLLVFVFLARFLGWCSMSTGKFALQLEGQFGFRVVSSKVGDYCLVFNTPGWGAVLRAITSPLRQRARLHFLAATPRPLPHLRLQKNTLASDEPEIQASFEQRIRPLVEQLATKGCVLDGSIGGNRIELIVEARKLDPVSLLVQMLELIRQLLEWLQDPAASQAPTDCMVCGEPHGERPCSQCKTPFHKACWQRIGVCHVWGCSAKSTLLDVLQRSA